MMLLDLIEANTAKVYDYKVRDEEARKSSEQHQIVSNSERCPKGTVLLSAYEVPLLFILFA